MKPYQKVLLVLLAVIITAAGGIQLYFSYYLDNHLKSSLINHFNTATDSNYELDIGASDLEFWGRRLKMKDIRLSTKKDSVEYQLQATLDALNVQGIGFVKLLMTQNLSLQEIELVNPSVNITAAPEQNYPSYNMELTNLSRSLSEALLENLGNITIPRLLIRGFSATYNRAGLPIEPYISFQDSYIQLQNITIDTTSIKDRRILPADDITAVFRDVCFNSDSKLYKLSANKLHFISDARQINISSIKLIPRFSKGVFTRKVNHETNRISMNIDHIRWKDINTKQLNRAEGIKVGHVIVNAPEIDIYRDKNPPFPPNRQPPLPQQMIRDLTFPFTIDSLKILDGNIRYSKLLPLADKPGHITFANLDATFRNISNLEDNWNNGTTFSLEAKTDIMNAATLHARFTFPMNTNRQYIDGQLKSLDMKSLNKALVPLASLRVKSGTINKLNFDMILEEKNASGNVTLLYDNLKISMLDDNFQENKKFISLLANTFKVKSGNSKEDPRVGRIDFKRDLKKSVFNYWWKSLLSGLKSCIGI